MRKVEHADIKLVIGGMAFTWDDKKAAANFRKHGITFEDAANAFFDEGAVIRFNSIDDYTGEERFDVIGWVYGNLMFVVYVERVTVNKRDVIRIISARFATNREEDIYAYGVD